LLDECDDVIGHVKDAHALLRSVYQNPAVPLSVRMKAASIAIEYERPSLKATAIVPVGGDFAARLEKAIERSASNGANNQPKLIEAQPTIEHSPNELQPTATPQASARSVIRPRRRISKI
jgi:hypothetical protein